MPASTGRPSASSNSHHASSAVHGGTRYIRLATRVAAPRWISRYSSELPPSVSTSTDQANAPISSGCGTTGSASSRASGAVTTNAATSWIVFAVRTSHGATKRFWYSVPAVIDASASSDSARFGGVTSPRPNLRPTTSTSPASPSPSPSHCRALTRCS